MLAKTEQKRVSHKKHWTRTEKIFFDFTQFAVINSNGLSVLFKHVLEERVKTDNFLVCLGRDKTDNFPVHLNHVDFGGRLPAVIPPKIDMGKRVMTKRMAVLPPKTGKNETDKKVFTSATFL